MLGLGRENPAETQRDWTDPGKRHASSLTKAKARPRRSAAPIFGLASPISEFAAAALPPTARATSELRIAELAVVLRRKLAQELQIRFAECDHMDRYLS